MRTIGKTQTEVVEEVVEEVAEVQEEKPKTPPKQKLQNSKVSKAV